MKKLKVLNDFFIKENHFEEWQEASRSYFKALLSEREQPLTNEEKSRLPQFGIGKVKGSKCNRQLFPTNFIITELDVPRSEKEKLSHQEKFKKWSPKFKEIYEKAKADEDSQYWAMYVTSSMCGIRFILKTDTPISSKDEYEKTAMNYLIGLKRFGVNEDYIDIAVNQAWYVPTFKDYFDQPRKKIIVQQKGLKEFTSVFKKVLGLTEKKEKFIEGNRNNFVHQLACNANRYGIERLATLMQIEENGYNYDPKEVESTVNNVYQNNQSEFGKSKYQNNEQDATVPLNQQIRRLRSMPSIPLIWSGIKQGSVGVIYGPPKSGKSTFCECLAMSLSSGMDKFMGIDIIGGPYKVLIISMEEYWQRRAERNKLQRNFLYSKFNKRFGNKLISSTEKYPNYIMANHDLEFIESQIRNNQPQIVIIDSLSHMIVERIEESSATNKILLKVKDIAANNGITLILIHHTTKDNKKGLGLHNLAGSRIIGQEADFIIGINQIGETRYLKEVAFRYAESNEKVQVFSINKSRWIEPEESKYEYEILNNEDGRIDNTNTDLILEYIQNKGKVRTVEVIKEFKGTISERTVKNQLSKLIKQGKVEKVEKGVYRPSANK